MPSELDNMNRLRVEALRERDDALLKLSTLRNIVSVQAEDEGLWFQAATAPEAYLQQELRKLHAAIEAPSNG
jgi:hypothetical protein